MNDCYSIYLDKAALNDISESVDYYEKQQKGLGDKFIEAVEDKFSILEKNPFFAIRYDNVRCVPLKTFPFLIHYTISSQEKKLIIRAVFHTSKNPNWSNR
ncbi:type II toxin-antitoxin system RelE/ParE family toxin [Algoriphagus marincola]|uniref:type II toxin-antitoxin system RelE/ParE family toxin n=1 Tax=Algoriphagus marincola TaxID=264027 RepID=UPI00041878FB|nr:type II toxin-antitoxin system RelE/ParE family toxin [Algoriphagus marincola]